MFSLWGAGWIRRFGDIAAQTRTSEVAPHAIFNPSDETRWASQSVFHLSMRRCGSVVAAFMAMIMLVMVLMTMLMVVLMAMVFASLGGSGQLAS